MKTTIDKPRFTIEQAGDLAAGVADGRPESLVQLVEGYSSQAYRFETSDNTRLVLRIGATASGFRMDQYAYEHFNRPRLPVPEVLNVGETGTGQFYCVSQYIDGAPSDQLTDEQLHAALPAVHEVFAEIYNTDISGTAGYGPIDPETGNGLHQSWRKVLTTVVDAYEQAEMVQLARKIGLEAGIVGQFFVQFYDNVDHLPEDRYLVHWDLGFDNLLVEDSKVTAVIDWAETSYGDWLYDFARLEYWGPGRYGDPQAFAEKYQLNAERFDQRIAAYWAYNMLTTIDFAVKQEGSGGVIAGWLRQCATQKLR